MNRYAREYFRSEPLGSYLLIIPYENVHVFELCLNRRSLAQFRAPALIPMAASFINTLAPILLRMAAPQAPRFGYNERVHTYPYTMKQYCF